jgi:hypothetical protein
MDVLIFGIAYLVLTKGFSPKAKAGTNFSPQARLVLEMISFLIYVYLLLTLYDRQLDHYHLSLPPLIVSSHRALSVCLEGLQFRWHFTNMMKGSERLTRTQFWAIILYTNVTCSRQMFAAN